MRPKLGVSNSPESPARRAREYVSITRPSYVKRFFKDLQPKMFHAKQSDIQQLHKEVEQLRREVRLRRMKVSQCSNE